MLKSNRLIKFSESEKVNDMLLVMVVMVTCDWLRFNAKVNTLSVPKRFAIYVPESKTFYRFHAY